MKRHRGSSRRAYRNPSTTRACWCVRYGKVVYWAGRNVFLSEVLDGERIGLEPVDDRYYRVYLASFPIALFDSQQRCMRNLPKQEGGGNDGNPKTGDSHISTAPATANY